MEKLWGHCFPSEISSEIEFNQASGISFKNEGITFHDLLVHVLILMGVSALLCWEYPADTLVILYFNPFSKYFW